MAFLDHSQLSLPLSTKSKSEVRYNCPYCDDMGYHLYVNLRKGGVFHCFKCGAKGKTNVHLVIGENYYDVEKEHAGAEFEYIKLPKPVKDILTWTGRRYLEKRGIFESDVYRHKVYCASYNSLYCGRIIIPCNASRGYCDYFAARAYTKLGFPKYLNPPRGKYTLFESPKELDRYQEQLWPQSHVVLVEGPFDYLKASRHGPTVALLGKGLSDVLVKRLAASYNKAWILLDQGIREGMAAIELDSRLGIFMDTEILKCPKKDPGDMELEDFKTLFKGK